jgi:hypothetical protein
VLHYPTSMPVPCGLFCHNGTRGLPRRSSLFACFPFLHYRCLSASGINSTRQRSVPSVPRAAAGVRLRFVRAYRQPAGSFAPVPAGLQWACAYILCLHRTVGWDSASTAFLFSFSHNFDVLVCVAGCRADASAAAQRAGWLSFPSRIPHPHYLCANAFIHHYLRQVHARLFFVLAYRATPAA